VVKKKAAKKPAKKASAKRAKATTEAKKPTPRKLQAIVNSDSIRQNSSRALREPQGRGAGAAALTTLPPDVATPEQPTTSAAHLITPDMPPLLKKLLSRPIPVRAPTELTPPEGLGKHRAMVERGKEHVFNMLGYTPHPGQRAFHASTARFKVLVAGARFGKSLAAAREVLPWLSVAGSRGWIVAPSYRLGEKEFRYLAADAKALFEDGAVIHYGGYRGPSSITVRDGGEAHVLSSADPDALLGEELDWVILGEASRMEPDVWPRYLRARLATRGGIAVIPSTPAGFNWMHDVFLRGYAEDASEWESFHYRTADNPLIPAKEIEEAEKSMPAATFAEQYGGEFNQPAGVVFPEFDPAVHVIGEGQLREIAVEGGQWRTYGGTDWGFRDPFVLLYAVVGAEGMLVITDEVVVRGVALDELLEKHIDLQKLSEMEVVFCDPSSPASIAKVKKESKTKVEGADNTIFDGIELVRARLVGRSVEKPGLRIHKRCKNLLREITRYSWSEHRIGGNPVPAPGQSDHTVDALRYLCMGLDGKPKTKATQAR